MYDIEPGTIYYDQAIINTSLEALIALVMSNGMENNNGDGKNKIFFSKCKIFIPVYMNLHTYISLDVNHDLPFVNIK